MSSFTCEFPTFFSSHLYVLMSLIWFLIPCLPAMWALNSTDTDLLVWPSLWWITIGFPPTTLPGKQWLLSATSAGRGDPTPQQLARASSQSFSTCLAVNPVVHIPSGCIKLFCFFNIGFFMGDHRGVGLVFQLLLQYDMKSHSIQRYLCQVWELLSSVCSPLQKSQSWGCWTLASETGRLRSLSAGWRRLRSQWRRSKSYQCCLYWCFLTTSYDMCFCTGTMFTIFYFDFYNIGCYCLFSNYTKMKKKRKRKTMKLVIVF